MFADIQHSFVPEKNQDMALTSGHGAGRSGSLFFFSSDNKFLIKTLKIHEKNELLSSLDDYINHVKSTKNKSLLARIYGVFSLKLPNAPDMDFLIMQNVAQLKNSEEKLFEFDLKGSSIDRYVSIDQEIELLQDEERDYDTRR